jgi:uncharacterized protein (DUF3084 family)
LWGQSLSVQEVMIGVPIDMEKASLIANDLNAARARNWSLPLIAVELGRTDLERAIALLQAEQRALETQTGAYRDLQLRGVAIAWLALSGNAGAEVQPSMAVSAAGRSKMRPSARGPCASCPRSVPQHKPRARLRIPSNGRVRCAKRLWHPARKVSSMKR